jgi:hypothetical protein
MKVTWMIVATLVLGLGCKKDQLKTQDPVRSSDTAWDLAPEGAAFGMVFQAGSLEHVRSVLAAVLVDASAHGLGPLVAKMHGALDRELGGADFTAAATWAERGIDPGKPFAFFVIPRVGEAKDRKFMLLPVGDRAKFRSFSKATVEKDGSDEVDVIEDKVRCLMLDSRYVCARTVADARLMVSKHDSPLARRVAALPADARGDFTLYADLTRFDVDTRDMREIEKSFGQVTQVGLAISMLPDGLAARGWASGSFTAMAAKLMKVHDKLPDAFIASTGGASSVTRLQLDLSPFLLMLPGTIPLEGSTVDARTAFFEQLTGDVQLVTGGAPPYGATLRIGVKDPAVVSPAIEAACTLGAKYAAAMTMPLTVTPGAAACDVLVDFAKIDAALTFPALPVHISVAGSGAIVIQLGASPSTSGNVASVAGSAETKAMLSSPASAMIWTRDFAIPTDLLPPALVDKLKSVPQAMIGMAVFEWLQLRVAELGETLTISPTRASIAVRPVTFAGDPQAAIDGYEAARKLGGEARHKALGELVARYGQSKIGQRAALELAGNGGLLSPFGSMIWAGMWVGFARMPSAEPAAPPAPAR